MKKRVLSIALTLVILAALIPFTSNPARADDFTPVTGADMLSKILLGINFANTLEATPFIRETRDWMDPHTLETETIWNEPKIEQWQFEAVAMKGYTAVRLPVTWEPHMDREYKIDKEWMDRVQQCVDWELEAGLYVIINTHHEWEYFYEFVMNSNHEAAKTELTAIWTQIAERFKDYSEKLIFEPMNEPNQPKFYWVENGGHNDKRVVLECVPGSSCDAIEFYKQPDAPYTMLGVFAYPDHDMNKIKPAVDRGIPVIVKEIATDEKSMTDAEKLEWTQTTHNALAEMGVPSFWWNESGDFELFDRFTGEWPRKAQLEAVFTACGQTPGPDYEYTPPPPAPPALPYELAGSFTDGEYTFWTPPKQELAAAEKLVVEYDGALSGGWYAFARFDPEPAWAQYDIGDKRITVEDGKLTFDLRGLEGNMLGFYPPDGDSAKIKRVYIDTWAGVKPVPAEKPAAWAEAGVARAVEAGIVPRELQGQYSQDITRAEFCALAVALYEAHTGKPIIARQSFPDDRGDVNIRKMAALKVVGGSDGWFDPDGVFDRQSAAVLTVNLLDALGKPLAKKAATFADKADIASWALVQAGQVQAASIMVGSGGKLDPKGKYDRQSGIMVMLNRDYLNK